MRKLQDFAPGVQGNAHLTVFHFVYPTVLPVENAVTEQKSDPALPLHLPRRVVTCKLADTSQGRIRRLLRDQFLFGRFKTAPSPPALMSCTTLISTLPSKIDSQCQPRQQVRQ